MLKRHLAFVMTFIVLLIGGTMAHAQSDVLVSGRVTSSVDGGPMAGVEVYIFKTVGDGVYEYKRAEQMYESGYVPEGLVRDVMSRQDGEYELTVPMYGALLFYKHPFKPVLVKVRGRSRHDVVIEATRVITDALIVEEGKKVTRKGKVVGFGNKFTVKDFPYFIDVERLGDVQGAGRTNARLVTQMFLTNADGTDTLEYYSPRVYDGEQFHRTQYHWRRDRLYEIADTLPRLTPDRDSVMFNLQFKVDHPEQLYFCKANIWIQDYIKTYYRDTVELLNTGRVSRPFQFLEYSFAHGELDPQVYYKEPRRELVATPKNMKLKFRQESALLDLSDRKTAAALDSLKEELRYISADPASTLKEIHFHGFASPEGPYEKNLALSHKRTATVKGNVLSCLPSETLSRVYSTSLGSVVPWSQVADLLESDSYAAEAETMREIIRKHPRNIGAQGFLIKKLGFYRKLIIPRLEGLRMVKCEYVAEVSRYLTPEEILLRYNSDPDFASGKKSLTLNEYWHLFKLIKDPQELERLYRHALEASFKAEREYWALPANRLAVTMLEKKQVDTLLLKPFINERRPLNYSLMDMDTGKRRIVNAEAVIVNQVLMFMLAKNYVRAEELSSIVAHSHPMLRAIVCCLGGYLDLEKPEDVALIEKIGESSVRNRVIVNLYTERFDSTTVAALNKLPSDEALTMYLKAQRLCLQHSNQAVFMRSADFDRDEDITFRHPDDKEIPAATDEEIAAVRKAISDLEQEAEAYREMGLISEVQAVEKDIMKEKSNLSDMENRLPIVDPAPCKVYEAAYIYLKSCFEKDSRFILTAKSDADINEDLLNDVLGIKQTKK